MKGELKDDEKVIALKNLAEVESHEGRIESLYFDDTLVHEFRVL